MGHAISALVVNGRLKEQAVKDWDLIVEELPFELKLCYIDHYYTACWQKSKNLDGVLDTSEKPPLEFPTDIVLLDIAKELLGDLCPTFAIIYTEYFGGVGEQFAQLYQGVDLVDLEASTINQALKGLGIQAGSGNDEFDTVGLGDYRHNPDYLDKYWDLADELGV